MHQRDYDPFKKELSEELVKSFGERLAAKQTTEIERQMQLNGGNIVSHGAGTLFNYIIASGSMGIGWFENNDDQLLVDSFSIWNRVLTPEERSNLYNNGRGRVYPFN